jgi:hypothetical protein
VGRIARELLLAVLVVSLMPGQAGAQPATGTIVFRPYMCPYGYDAQFYPQVCRLYAANSTASIAHVQSAPINANVGIDGAVFTLLPGVYFLHSGIPGDFSYQQPVRCWIGETEIPEPISITGGERVECEQIIFPVSGRAQNPADEIDATLTIRARYCDPGIERTEFHVSCFDQPATNLEFTVRDREYSTRATTDPAGNVTINLPDFSYSINLVGPLAATPVWRFCSTVEHPGIPLLYPIQFYGNSGSITCDIYLLPEIYDLAPSLGNRQVGEIEVHYRECPAGYTGSDFYRECHDELIPFAAIDILPGSYALPAHGFTGVDGNVTFRVIADTYEFPPEILGEPVDRISVFCANNDESRVAVAYPVMVMAEDHVVCDLYLLPAAETESH